MRAAKTMRNVTFYRLLNAIVLGLVVALGLGSKAYSGWGQSWINHFSGDILYEIFWIWLVGAWKVRWRSHHIATVIFVLTAMIEITQLIPVPPSWQAQLWWRLLLGTTFSWADFLYYAIGCILGGLSLFWLKQQFGLCVLPLPNPHRRKQQP